MCKAWFVVVLYDTHLSVYMFLKLEFVQKKFSTNVTGTVLSNMHLIDMIVKSAHILVHFITHVTDQLFIN